MVAPRMMVARRGRVTLALETRALSGLRHGPRAARRVTAARWAAAARDAAAEDWRAGSFGGAGRQGWATGGEAARLAPLR